jgi:hypothetical protein
MKEALLDGLKLMAEKWMRVQGHVRQCLVLLMARGEQMVAMKMALVIAWEQMMQMELETEKASVNVLVPQMPESVR